MDRYKQAYHTLIDSGMSTEDVVLVIAMLMILAREEVK